VCFRSLAKCRPQQRGNHRGLPFDCTPTGYEHAEQGLFQGVVATRNERVMFVHMTNNLVIEGGRVSDNGVRY
jgi:hypothetical protein